MTAGGAPAVLRSLELLRAHVEAGAMRGQDPYDLLASSLPLTRLGHRACFLLTQLHKRSPVNLRRLLGIAPVSNPKAVGLLLAAYGGLARCENSGVIAAGSGEGASSHGRLLARRLLDDAVPTGKGIAWGLPFAHASRVEMIPARTPSLVVTAFAHRGLREYHRQTGDAETLAALRDSCRFVLEDLPRFEDADGTCFAYTPTNPIRCYNATMLAAEMLAGTASATGDEELLGPARRTVEFVLAKQHEDGHWAYSMAPDGREKQQIDFHQGFVLSSLRAYADYSGDEDPHIAAAIERGAAYYRRTQFTAEGRSLWRVPKRFPVDIHNQAQGILTFAELSGPGRGYMDFAGTIAGWTIRNMQDPAGYFYYRRGRLLTNRIDYLRWAQAWMMLALVTLLEKSTTP